MAAPRASSLQRSGILSREQLFRLFSEFQLVDRPEVKRRISDAVESGQEAVAVTTEIQEEIFLRMGVEPKFGIISLGKVNTVYKDDRELMLKFYEFVAREEMACDEAELGKEGFHYKMLQYQKSQEQQLKILQQLRNLPLDRQRAFLQEVELCCKWVGLLKLLLLYQLQAKMRSQHKQGDVNMTSQDIQYLYHQFVQSS